MLGSANNIDVKDAHANTKNDAFDVDPEDLAAVPGVEQVEATSCEGWNVDTSDLEQSIPVHTLVVLHAILKHALVLELVHEGAVLEAEELERSQHRPIDDGLGSLREIILILFVELISALEHAGLHELVEDAVKDVVDAERKDHHHST